MLELQLIGNITRDAEVKQKNGSAFITFSVAENETYKDNLGNKQQKVTYVDCVKFFQGETPRILPYLRKGTRVFVRGNVSCKAFQRTNGTLDAAMSVRVSNLLLLGGQNEVQTAQHTTPSAVNMPAFATAPVEATTAVDDDGLPF